MQTTLSRTRLNLVSLVALAPLAVLAAFAIVGTL